MSEKAHLANWMSYMKTTNTILGILAACAVIALALYAGSLIAGSARVSTDAQKARTERIKKELHADGYLKN